MRSDRYTRIGIIAAIVLSGANINGFSSEAETTEESGPRISFVETSRSFGTFGIEEIQKAEFEFVNTGDEPLLIIRLATDCGCTAAAVSGTTIAPGDTGRINVSYNGRNYPAGSFRKQIKVKSNDPTKPLVRLIITGKSIKG